MVQVALAKPIIWGKTSFNLATLLSDNGNFSFHVLVLRSEVGKADIELESRDIDSFQSTGV